MTGFGRFTRRLRPGLVNWCVAPFFLQFAYEDWATSDIRLTVRDTIRSTKTRLYHVPYRQFRCLTHPTRVGAFWRKFSARCWTGIEADHAPSLRPCGKSRNGQRRSANSVRTPFDSKIYMRNGSWLIPLYRSLSAAYPGIPRQISGRRPGFGAGQSRRLFSCQGEVSLVAEDRYRSWKCRGFSLR